jgi:N-acetylglutamate synthase-like GNAT family acetyltransferase
MQEAKHSDLSEIKTLLQINGLPADDINEEITFYIIRENGRIIGVGGLETAGEDVLMRSIAISDRFKNKGLGARITQLLIENAKIAGYSSIYLLTLTAEKFFPRFGFVEIERGTASESIKLSSEFTSTCPASACLMQLKLK